MRVNPRPKPAWFLTAALAAALAACGGQPEGAGPQQESGEAATTTEAGADIAPGAEVEVKNPDALVTVGIADFIDSLDPAYAYDTGSGTIIQNVYDTLIGFDGGHTDQFVARLATEVPSVKNGLIRDEGRTYVFPIRAGVSFQEGGTLDAEDVAYSIQRGLLQDRVGGPQWLMLEPLLGVSSIKDLAIGIEAESSGQTADTIEIEAITDLSSETLAATCERVKAAVAVEDGSVVFRLVEPFPAFLPVMAGQWASALDREWVSTAQTDESGAEVKAAGWDGSCATWQDFYDPALEESPLRAVANGTGPYKLASWRRDEEIALERNEAYWDDPKPALRQILFKFNPEFSSRLLMFQTGDADMIHIPPPNEDQLEPLVADGSVTLYPDLPEVSMGFWVLNQKVAAEDNEYIGSGQLDGAGVPPDFFSDPDVRKGFALAYDRDTFVNEITPGYARPALGPIPSFMTGFNPQQPSYAYDLAAATEAFQRAFDGQLWETGFTLAIPMVPGAETSRLNREMFKASIAEINPKFVIEIREVQSSEYTEDSNNDKFPISASGWVQDYHDPHNWVFPLLHSQGYYSHDMDFAPEVAARLDDLIGRAKVETDPAAREALYHEIQQIYYDEALMIPIDEDIGRVYMRSWVKGYVHNPARPGMVYAELSKQP